MEIFLCVVIIAIMAHLLGRIIGALLLIPWQAWVAILALILLYAFAH